LCLWGASGPSSWLPSSLADDARGREFHARRRAVHPSRNPRFSAAINILHHGFGYVIDLWPAPSFVGIAKSRALFGTLKVVVNTDSVARKEPYSGMPDDGDGWARLYWRLRYGGTTSKVAERLTFDLAECLR
jgi:hypothetical protein